MANRMIFHAFHTDCLQMTNSFRLDMDRMKVREVVQIAMNSTISGRPAPCSRSLQYYNLCCDLLCSARTLHTVAASLLTNYIE